MLQSREMLFQRYLLAKAHVIRSGYEHEIAWQESIDRSTLRETDLLRECAWVILSCGMRESTVRRVFPGVERAFHSWPSASHVVTYGPESIKRAQSVFSHQKKLAAIVEFARGICDSGFERFVHRIETDGAAWLTKFAYFGPASSAHLLKNVGVQIAKPDRHLQRIAKVTGFKSAADICRLISTNLGDDVAVVDLVLWRFCALEGRRALSFFDPSGSTSGEYSPDVATLLDTAVPRACSALRRN